MLWSLAADRSRSRHAAIGNRTFDICSSLAGAVMLCAWAGHTMLADNALSDRSGAQPADTTLDDSSAGRLPGREYVVAGYSGAPYTRPSDVRFSKPGSTSLTVHGVRWEGQPFRSPIYYGIRTLRWGKSQRFGAMLDFTHSKTISQREQVVQRSGTRKGQPLSGPAKIGDTFRHFEFSHGHNTLILTGLLRLADVVPHLAPYIGGGVGIALPHTEVQFVGDKGRTYEYQYAGPAAQGVLGLELRAFRTSLFIEYKFTIAHYTAPMTGRDGSWFPQDFWRQFVGYRNGETPADGFLTTILASHQVVAGLGVRSAAVPAPAP